MKMEKFDPSFSFSFVSTQPFYPASFANDVNIDANALSQYSLQNACSFNEPNLHHSILPPLPPADPFLCNFLCLDQDFSSALPFDYSSSLIPYQPNIADAIPDPVQFLDFFSKPLPDFHSLEQSRLASSSTRKLRIKDEQLDLNLSDNNPQTLHSIVQSFKYSPPLIPHSEIARKRRQKLSEKTRCLQKIMPWDKKMDTGTLLQEASKYVQFLQAQVSILQSMPITSSFESSEIKAPGGFDYGGLERLNRQQLLQVLLNSPVAQTMLYSQGFCVFAYEQLVSLTKAKERKAVLQQFFFGN